MADLAPVYAALQKADAAGDSAGAKQLADYIRSQAAPSPARSFDSVNGELVPTGSAYAKAAESPIARADPNSPQPVESEIGAMLSNYLAGRGKAVVDLGRGAGQYLGLVSRNDVQASRERDAPLMATGAGKLGNIEGNVTSFLPALAIPGANTIAGAGAIGAVTGALQPSVSTGETLRNTALGGALGAGGQAVGNAVAAGAQRILASRAAKATDEAAQNSVRDATLKTAQDAGYVIPPANVNEGATAHALEGVSGKIATEQVARVKNQAVTDNLVRQDLNLPKNTPLTPATFDKVRADAGKVYTQVKQQSGPIKSDAQYLDDVTNLVKAQNDVAGAYPGAKATAGPEIESLADSLLQDTHSAPQLLEYSKQLRNQAKGNFAAAAQGNPEARAIAQAQWDASGALEDLMKRNLQAQGKTALADSFDAARTTIAKAHTAENALIEGQGHIDAKVLGRQLKKGVPLSDGFDTAARFAQAFPKAAGIPQGSAGVSKLTAVTTLEALSHGKLGLAAALAASAPTRSALLSGLGQKALARPSYAPNALGTIALNALKQSPRAVLPGTAATLPLIEAN